MFPTLSLGPISLPLPELLLIIGVWTGSALATRRSKLFQISPKALENLVLTGIILGIVGGRLSYIASNLSSFQGNFRSIFSLNPNLIDLQGGVAISLLISWVLVNRKNWDSWTVLDALTPFFGMLYLSISLHHFAAGSNFGSPTTLPWGIELWGASRHPVQLYHAIGSALILGFLLRRPPQHQKPPGTTFLIFSGMSLLWMIFTSGFKQTSQIIGPGLRTNQIAAWLLLCVVSYFFHIRQRIAVEENKYGSD